MADIKRYDCCDHTSGAAMHESAAGKFVKHSDMLAAVAAEREACALIANKWGASYTEDEIRARGAAHD